MKRRTVAVTFLLMALAFSTPYWLPRLLWERQPWRVERVQLIDYTVPYRSAREHRGAIWVLNHEKYRPPTGAHWEALGSHVGYDPEDRDHPRAVAQLDLSRTDWVILTDAYGVYRDDLKDVFRERAHMDYNPRLFGGLSLADADTLGAHAARGHHFLLEFNALEEPTTPAARARLESLLGVEWTGWTGRVFLDLHDTTDVPYWLPRLYREQYGSDSMPHDPVLALSHKDGRLFLLPAPSGRQAAPRIALTAAGRREFRRASSGAAYYYWFPIVRAGAGTEVLAELALPPTSARDSVLARVGLPSTIPLLTRRVVNGSHRLYLAADLADTDFDPGPYHFAGLGRLRTATENNPFRIDGENTFWQFYVPAITRVLRAPFDGPVVEDPTTP